MQFEDRHIQGTMKLEVDKGGCIKATELVSFTAKGKKIVSCTN